jgi:hypothetical protein
MDEVRCFADDRQRAAHEGREAERRLYFAAGVVMERSARRRKEASVMTGQDRANTLEEIGPLG